MRFPEGMCSLRLCKPKINFVSQEVPAEMFEAIKDFAIDKVKAALDTDDKNIREERLAPVVAEIHEKFDEVYPEEIAKIDECIYKLQKFVVRRWLLDEGKRVDDRGLDEIRPLAAEVGLIPRVHGSGMFTPRPDPGAGPSPPWAPSATASCWMALTTRKPNGICTSTTSPPYSVGETRPSRGPGRRKLATAPWRRRLWCRCSPRWRSSPTPCAWSLRFCPPTAPPPKVLSAVPPCL